MAGDDRFRVAQVHNVVDLPLLDFPFLIRETLCDAQPLAVDDLHVLFVDGQPVLDSVAEVFKQDSAVVVEFIDDGPIVPAAVLLIDPAGHIVVIDRDDRFDSRSLEFVDQVVVEFDSLRIDFSVGCRNDSRPGDTETVAGKAAFLHQSDVFLVVMVVVRCDGVIRKRFLCL